MSVNQTANKVFVPADNVVIRPMFSYMYYLMIRIIKNKSTWILAILTFIFAIGIAIVPIVGPSEADQHNLARSMNLVGAIAVVIFSMFFGTIKALNIFTDSQSDGTELIIVSKPISRTQILIARYAFFIILMLIFSLLVMLAWAVGMAISGYGLVKNPGASIGGIFTSSFISAIATGVIAILIAFNFSSRVARVLPIALTSLSAMIFVIPMFSSVVPSLGQPGFTESQLAELQFHINSRKKKSLLITLSKEIAMVLLWMIRLRVLN